MTDINVLLGAQARAGRRLRTIQQLRAELARIEALLPEGVSIEQLVATYNLVHDDEQWPDSYLPAYMVLEIVREVQPT